MAKILTTKGSAAALEDLIRRAERELYIISFSFIISDTFITKLKQATEKGIIINLVFGKSIRPDSIEKLIPISNLKIFQLENLHAKIFANETKCLIGSMNFSEASEINNTELGVLLSSVNDAEAFKDAINHCKDILGEATLVRPMMPKHIADNYKPVKPTEGIENNSFFNKKNTEDQLGYCIRTRKRIPLNHERPFSKSAYEIWAEWENEDFAEVYDHFTGEESFGKTSKSSPILNKNWKKYKRLVG